MSRDRIAELWLRRSTNPSIFPCHWSDRTLTSPGNCPTRTISFLGFVLIVGFTCSILCTCSVQSTLYTQRSRIWDNNLISIWFDTTLFFSFCPFSTKGKFLSLEPLHLLYLSNISSSQFKFYFCFLSSYTRSLLQNIKPIHLTIN